MAAMLYGFCEICREEKPLRVTYFEYPEIECECHGSGGHAVRVEHCADCIPKEPMELRVTLNTKKVKNMTSKLVKADDKYIFISKE